MSFPDSYSSFSASTSLKGAEIRNRPSVVWYPRCSIASNGPCDAPRIRPGTAVPDTAYLKWFWHVGLIGIRWLRKATLVLLGTSWEEGEAAKLISDSVVLALLFIVMRARMSVLQRKVQSTLCKSLTLALFDLEGVIRHVRRELMKLQFHMPEEGGLGARLLVHTNPKLMAALIHVGATRTSATGNANRPLTS